MEFAVNAVPFFLFAAGISGLFFSIRSLRRAVGLSSGKQLLYGLGLAISVTAICLAWLTTRTEFIFRVH
jgi:hypothetical protein